MSDRDFHWKGEALYVGDCKTAYYRVSFTTYRATQKYKDSNPTDDDRIVAKTLLSRRRPLKRKELERFTGLSIPRINYALKRLYSKGLISVYCKSGNESNHSQVFVLHEDAIEAPELKSNGNQPPVQKQEAEGVKS